MCIQVLPKEVFKRWISPLAPMITISQIVQMVAFLLVNGVAYAYVWTDPSRCHVKIFNLAVNATVVAIYLALFVAFFLSRYVRQKAA